MARTDALESRASTPIERDVTYVALKRSTNYLGSMVALGISILGALTEFGSAPRTSEPLYIATAQMASCTPPRSFSSERKRNGTQTAAFQTMQTRADLYK
ncbi:hypothetical protein BG58_18485 [Caballeronia jiangsuensis]|nr:hypothetical protein BG58_18485 [Caballeronia jiangsuensis]